METIDENENHSYSSSVNITTHLAPHLERQVGERLSQHGARFTSARRRIVGALSRAQGPRSAVELSVATERTVPVSSLYRNLSVLADAGVVSPHHGAGGLTRYELSEWLAGHHHHLVCTRCGQVDDVDVGEQTEAALDSLARSAGRAFGFKTQGHSLEIEGECRSCVEAGPPQ